MLMLLCWNLPSSSDWCLELLFQVYEHVPFSSYASFCLVRNTKGVILRCGRPGSLQVARWHRCLHCRLTTRRSLVRFPHGALLALGGRSSPDLQCSGGLSPGPFCVEFA